MSRHRYQRGCATLRQDLPRLGVTFTAAHSPTTFLDFRSAATLPVCVPVAEYGGPSAFPVRQGFSLQCCLHSLFRFILQRQK
jgi:hypothetical protein